jgi:hypothetical protein
MILMGMTNDDCGNSGMNSKNWGFLNCNIKNTEIGCNILKKSSLNNNY